MWENNHDREFESEEDFHQLNYLKLKCKHGCAFLWHKILLGNGFMDVSTS